MFRAFQCGLLLVVVAFCSDIAPLWNGNKHSISAPSLETPGHGCLTTQQRDELRLGISAIGTRLDAAVEFLGQDADAAELVANVRDAILVDLELVSEDPCPTCTAVVNTVHDNLQSHGFLASPSLVTHIQGAQWALNHPRIAALHTIASALSLTSQICPSLAPAVGAESRNTRNAPLLEATVSSEPSEGDGGGEGEGESGVRAFMVLGDWGYNPECHGNVKSSGQRAIAASMKAEFDRRKGNASLPDVEFVINVGDSFYADGVHSVDDPRWTNVWADVYQLPGTTWYSTYGNHDLGRQDPCGTSLSATCVQIQKHGQTMNGMTWHLPNMSYVVEAPFPGLDIGIVSLDTNIAWTGEICKYLPNPTDCESTLKARYETSQQLLDATIDKAVRGEFAKNLLVFSHYPSDYCGQGTLPSAFCASLSRSGENGTKIHYFAGHRHAVDSTSVAPQKVANATSWLVGGGGGWGCDSSPNGQYENQGFMVGEVAPSGRVHSLRPIFTPRNQIC